MAVFVGIDEAGLGPILGPLCYGLISFIIPDDEALSWRKDLKKIIKDQCLSLNDSKKIYQGSGKIKKLNKAVSDTLGFLSDEINPVVINELFLNTSLNAKGNLECYPFYKDVLLANLPSKTNSVLSRQRSWKVDISVTACFEGEMNKVFSHEVNKSGLCLLKISSLIESVILAYPKEKIIFSIDKQGGRQFYSNFINDMFPFASIEIIKETPDISEYYLEINGAKFAVWLL